MASDEIAHKKNSNFMSNIFDKSKCSWIGIHSDGQKPKEFHHIVLWYDGNYIGSVQNNSDVQWTWSKDQLYKYISDSITKNNSIKK